MVNQILYEQLQQDINYRKFMAKRNMQMRLPTCVLSLVILFAAADLILKGEPIKMGTVIFCLLLYFAVFLMMFIRIRKKPVIVDNARVLEVFKKTGKDGKEKISYIVFCQNWHYRAIAGVETVSYKAGDTCAFLIYNSSKSGYIF